MERQLRQDLEEKIRLDWERKAEAWLAHLQEDDPLRKQLENIKDDKKQLEELFFKDLEFGTGGIRGEIGPGTNRMNMYTVRKAANGLAQYIVEQGCEAMRRGVVISYDSRHLSPQFALEVAKTVGKHGVKAYLFEELHPTPLLSFAVRYLQAFAGVMITASHNPPQYNGLKVYGEDGSQLALEASEMITSYIERTGNELALTAADEDELVKKGLLIYIGEEIGKAYVDALSAIQLNREAAASDADALSIVFTPLHGTAKKHVLDGLAAFGFSKVALVEEQAEPDPDFPTVASPNPEEDEAFQLAIEKGKALDADLLLAADPDADRLGAAVKKKEGGYVLLTGNQLGAILLHYLLEQKQKNGTLPQNGAVMKTIVTSEFGRAIASHFGMETIDTLTGFKFIGEKIHEFERTSEYTFLFGYEESYGYLIGDFVRDKDAVQAAVFTAEAAAYYKAQGKSLYDVLLSLYEQHGYYKESIQSLTLAGKAGAEKIQQILNDFRGDPPAEVSGLRVAIIEDYSISERIDVLRQEHSAISLPKANVLKYILEDGSWFCVRPSGTEPKCKFYFSVKGDSLEDAEAKLIALEEAVMERVKKDI